MPLSGKDTWNTIIRQAVGLRLLKKPSADREKKIGTSPYDGFWEVGSNFVVDTHSHDTGCSFDAWAFSGSGEVVRIVCATYWYSSRYTHNPETWIKGAALNLLNKEMSLLADRVIEAKKAQDSATDARVAAEKDEEQARLDKFNASFVGQPDNDEPNPKRFYKWIVELEVNETWVADGFELTQERMKSMLETDLGYANSSETRCRIIHSPSEDSIAKAQGYDSAEHRRQKESVA